MSTITSKGQITLPKAIRESLGVGPGDRIVFRERDDGEIVVEPATLDLRTLHLSLKPTRSGVSIEDMKHAVRRGSTRT